MRVNIWSKLSNIVSYLEWITAINDLFPWWVYAEKPASLSSWITDNYLYIELISNLNSITPDNSISLVKEWIINFVIIWKKQDVVAQDLYEILDTISNNIITDTNTNYSIDMGGFIVKQIAEGSQSGVIRDNNNIPFINAEYTFFYKSKY